MAVTQQTPRNVSTAAPGATVFPYNFRILDASDLLVTVDGVARTVNVHYTVSGVGAAGGGNVTFLTPLAGGETVLRKRAMPIERLTDYQNLGDLRSPTLNNDQDAPVMMLQQLDEAIGRALRIREDYNSPIDLLFPDPEPSRLIGWNVAGTGLCNTDPTGPGDLLRSDLADPTGGAALVAFRQVGAGAVGRTMLAKARDVVSLTDFGADPTGVADSLAAIQAAVDAFDHIFIPAGTYRLSAPLVIPGTRNIAIYGEGRLASVLQFSGASGGLRFSASTGGEHLTLRDFSITTSHLGTDYAIHVTYPSSPGGDRAGHVFADRITIHGQNFVSGGGYFKTGVYLDGARSCVFDSVSFRGRYDASHMSDYGFRQVGQSVNNIFRACAAGGVHTGFHVGGTSEGAQFYHCVTSLMQVGINCDCSGGRPQMVIDSCHLNTKSVGIRLAGVSQSFVRGNLLYSAPQGPGIDSTDYVGIWIDTGNVTATQVSDNIVIGLQTLPEDGLRVEQGTAQLLATNNQFQSLTGTALALDPLMLDSVVTGNRIYGGGTYISDAPENARGCLIDYQEGSGVYYSSAVGVERSEASANGPTFRLRKSRGSFGSPAAANAGDVIGRVEYQARTASLWMTVASIECLLTNNSPAAAILRVNAPWRFASYTVAKVPAANPSGGGAGQVIYVSNGDSGSPCLAVSDGTNWRRIPLGAAVSAA